MKPYIKKIMPCKLGGTGKVAYEGPLMLAKNFRNPRTGSAVGDPVGYYMSEKLDGYRCLWTGRGFVTRTGKPINAPVFFVDLMPPSVALDGELYMGRDTFESLGFIRRKVPDENLWKQLTFQVFDIPSEQNRPFEERMKRLKTIVRRRCVECAHMVPRAIPCPLRYVEQVKIKTAHQLDVFMDEVVQHRGEGVMLREAGSLYEPGRTSTLMKLKAEFDAECVIVGHKEGKGKYSGMLGSYQCEFLDGVAGPFFVSGMRDAMRTDPLPTGDIITIKYNGLTVKGLPRHPRFVRARNDPDF